MKKAKSLPKLKADLQKLFNEYIRERDKGEPCISCSQVKPNMQAGHYYPVKGYDGLRFNELNCHSECAFCNCYDEAHLIKYGDNLANKIGWDNYVKLKKQAEDYKQNGYKWSRTELIEMIQVFRDKLKELKS